MSRGLTNGNALCRFTPSISHLPPPNFPPWHERGQPNLLCRKKGPPRYPRSILQGPQRRRQLRLIQLVSLRDTRAHSMLNLAPLYILAEGKRLGAERGPFDVCLLEPLTDTLRQLLSFSTGQSPTPKHEDNGFQEGSDQSSHSGART